MHKAVSSLSPVNDAQGIQEEIQTERIAYIRDGDIFLYDHLSGQEDQVTSGKTYFKLFPFPDGPRIFAVTGIFEPQCMVYRL